MTFNIVEEIIFKTQTEFKNSNANDRQKCHFIYINLKNILKERKKMKKIMLKTLVMILTLSMAFSMAGVPALAIETDSVEIYADTSMIEITVDDLTDVDAAAAMTEITVKRVSDNVQVELSNSVIEGNRLILSPSAELLTDVIYQITIGTGFGLTEEVIKYFKIKTLVDTDATGWKISITPTTNALYDETADFTQMRTDTSKASPLYIDETNKILYINAQYDNGVVVNKRTGLWDSERYSVEFDIRRYGKPYRQFEIHYNVQNGEGTKDLMTGRQNYLRYQNGSVGWSLIGWVNTQTGCFPYADNAGTNVARSIFTGAFEYVSPTASWTYGSHTKAAAPIPVPDLYVQSNMYSTDVTMGIGSDGSADWTAEAPFTKSITGVSPTDAFTTLKISKNGTDADLFEKTESGLVLRDTMNKENAVANGFTESDWRTSTKGAFVLGFCGHYTDTANMLDLYSPVALRSVKATICEVESSIMEVKDVYASEDCLEVTYEGEGFIDANISVNELGGEAVNGTVKVEDDVVYFTPETEFTADSKYYDVTVYDGSASGKYEAVFKIETILDFGDYDDKDELFKAGSGFKMARWWSSVGKMVNFNADTDTLYMGFNNATTSSGGDNPFGFYTEGLRDYDRYTISFESKYYAKSTTTMNHTLGFMLNVSDAFSHHYMEQMAIPQNDSKVGSLNTLHDNKIGLGWAVPLTTVAGNFAPTLLTPTGSWNKQNSATGTSENEFSMATQTEGWSFGEDFAITGDDNAAFTSYKITKNGAEGKIFLNNEYKDAVNESKFTDTDKTFTIQTAQYADGSETRTTGSVFDTTIKAYDIPKDTATAFSYAPVTETAGLENGEFAISYVDVSKNTSTDTLATVPFLAVKNFKATTCKVVVAEADKLVLSTNVAPVMGTATITGSAYLLNATSSDLPVKVIAAGYDEEGNLTAIAISDITSATAKTNTTVPYTLTDAEDVKEIKVIVIKNFETLKPYTNELCY